MEPLVDLEQVLWLGVLGLGLGFERLFILAEHPLELLVGALA